MIRTRLAVAAVLPLALAVASVSLAASAKGGPSLQIFFQLPMKADYQQKTFARFARQWKQPAQVPQPGKKTVVQALIDKDGKVVSATVTTESGSKAWDKAALAAVKSAAPFGKLPASVTLPSVEVHFHVEWAAK
jgi:protein TonB